MSLLMEALRKAEEAKRQSAQRERSNEEAQVSAVAAAIPLGTEISELSALEAQIEDSQLETASATPATTETLPEYRFELDFPEETPVAAKAAQDEKAGEQNYSLEYPGEEAQEDVAAGKPLQDIPARESGLSLTLAEQPPTSRQVFMPELIVDELPTPSEPEIAAPAAPVLTPPPAPVIAAKVVSEPLVAESEVAEPLVAGPIVAGPAVTAPLRAEPTDAPGSPRFVPSAPRSEAQRRESARAIFNAKAGSPAARRRNLIGVAVLVALFPLAGGVYFLLQELGVFAQGNQYNIPASYDPSAVPVLAVEESADAVQDSALPDVLAVVDVVDAPVDAATLEVPVEPPQEVAVEAPIELPIAEPVEAPLEVALAVPVETSIETSVAAPAEVSSEVPAVESAAVTPAATPTTATVESPAPINIVRSSTPQIDPVIVQAYSAFQTRDYVDARALYQQALRATPNSRDAMLGIAAVAMLQGESTLARNMYTRLLEQDPRDALARAGLLETVPASDPVRTESELRSLFDSHPDVAPLAFALGNLYASQRRWNEAQQAYYDALRAAKAGASGLVSPDYAFNLAVSLERLNQPQSAYEFYREALQQSAQVQPNFDPRVLRQRLEDLERSLP
ncbi:MAG: tetratricopeptide repeat protein [Gammaproteobacteria bacterium]|nr:tetratricopeptide repeat protein [Gammaproteobacteria bacterium]